MERTTRLFNNVSDELFNIKHKLNDLEYLNINNSLKDLYNLVCDKNNEDEDEEYLSDQEEYEEYLNYQEEYLRYQEEYEEYLRNQEEDYQNYLQEKYDNDEHEEDSYTNIAHNQIFFIPSICYCHINSNNYCIFGLNSYIINLYHCKNYQHLVQIHPILENILNIHDTNYIHEIDWITMINKDIELHDDSFYIPLLSFSINIMDKLYVNNKILLLLYILNFLFKHLYSLVKKYPSFINPIKNHIQQLYLYREITEQILLKYNKDFSIIEFWEKTIDEIDFS